MGRSAALSLLGCALCCSALLATGSTEAQTLTEVVAAERSGSCHQLRSEALVRSPVETALRDLRMARCLVSEGAFDDGIRWWDRAAEAADDDDRADQVANELPWYPELAARIALLRGATGEAVERYRSLCERAGRGRVETARKARLLYYLGLSYESAGSIDQAFDVYERLVREFPGNRYILRALPLMLDVGLDAEQRLAMADAARRARSYETAERLLRAVACDGASRCVPRAVVTDGDGRRYEAAWRLGFLLYRYRRERVADGIPWLEAVSATPGPRRSDATYYLARAQMRLEDYNSARATWARFAGLFPDDGRVEDAAYYEGWLYLDHDDHAASIPGLTDFIRRYSWSDRADDARWHLGWANLRLDRFEEAIEQWEWLRGRRGWDEQSRYWIGVAYLRSGQTDRARDIWRGIARSDPFGYYGLLATRRLHGRPIDAAVPDLAFADAMAEYDGVVSSPVALADVGLTAEAGLIAELDPAVRSARLNDGAAAQLWRMRVHASHRDWSRWYQRYRSTRDEMPTTRWEHRAWRLSSPAFYPKLVEDVARANGIPDSMIWSVMQQESGFNPRVVSPSDAMGLMQVIPQTAEAIAEQLGERYADGMLYEPFYAIRYGGWYLGALLRKFRGQIPLAVIAYNAGPIATEEWVDRNAGMPFDEFVEEVAYSQARHYVKRVVSNMVRYEIASGDTSSLRSPTLGGIMPLQIDSGYLAEIRF